MNRINIHATCVRLAAAGNIFGAPPNAGVLLIGKSGSGKSDLALRLIARGAELVSDDRTELTVGEGMLMATPPLAIAGQLEVRGVGILSAPAAASAAVALVADLNLKLERLPEAHHYVPPGLQLAEALRPPLIALDAFEASAPDKVLAAVAALADGNFARRVKRIS